MRALSYPTSAKTVAAASMMCRRVEVPFAVGPGGRAGAHVAVYAATKALVLSFTRALWAETRHTGVAVLAVCPGATDTEFFQTAGEDASVGRRRSPEDVVNTALRALARHRPSVVDGHVNAIVAAVAARLPERMVISAAERSVRPAAPVTH